MRNHRKTDTLFLHVPSLSEMDYRQKMMADPETMSYNKGYDLDFPGYERESGCIAFPKEEWEAWYGRWIHNEPQRYYAYVMRKEDNMPLGEVNLYRHQNAPVYEMGVVIEACHRGRGYGLAALKLLLSHAFDEMHVKEVHNSFENKRLSAMAIHRKCGFEISGTDQGISQLVCTKESWLKSRVKMMERKELSETDIPAVLELYQSNPQYFRYCPPEPDEASVYRDMTVKPDGAGIIKHFCGWYEDDRLCAVMDLLENYPEKGTAWIGLFMMHAAFQRKGLGSTVIKMVCEAQKKKMNEIRLGCMENNISALNFWHACGFGTYGTREGIILMRRKL